MSKSPSQIKSQIRRTQRKQKQAINNLNHKVQKFVNEYNKFVRNYNATVKKNRRIISNETKKLNLSSHSSYVKSTQTMQKRYVAVSIAYPEGCEVTQEQNRILDLIVQEQANSIITNNVIENNEFPEEDTEGIEIGNKLLGVSEDLNNRWQGALYALNRSNPDASRQFCTSVREIFTEFIEMKAPDEEVFKFNPNCQKTDNGNATRREKIKFMMRQKEMDNSVIDFAEEDIKNILDLFHILSDGTHGVAGRYDFDMLLYVKKRAEQGINFLCEIS